ncbi:MAG: sigma-70 family RNA polymerase sigma factor [bacterium]|nr:sigma-70 family RNA polymerase sigma factor [bacterium]
MHLNSKEFIESFRKQEKEVFAQIVEEYSDRLYNLIYKMVLNRDDAKDILQNSFLKAYNAAPAFKGESSLYTYIAAIALNEARERFRKEKRHLFLDLDIIDSERQIPDVNEERERESVKKRVNNALSKLPETFREVLVMKDVDGLSLKEISEITKITEGGVKARLHRARMLFKRMLDD